MFSKLTRGAALAALLAAGATCLHAQVVVIDFDGLGNQASVVGAPYATASFSPYGIPPSHTGDVLTYAISLGTSQPNIICTALDGSITCEEDMAVDFPTPVRNLSFWAVGANRTGPVADVRVYVGGALAGTVVVRGTGSARTPVFVDLGAYVDVERIEIVDVRDLFGVGWDDFQFEIQHAPVFDPPTPCGQTLAVNVNQPIDFTVSVSDPVAAEQVQLDVSGLPAGAQLSPSLPSVGNPLVTTFTWTPTLADLGTHSLLFSADDGVLDPVTCTIDVEVLCPGSGLLYGTGTPGTGALVPVLEVSCPTIGETLVIDVREGLGGAPGCLLMGLGRASLPAFGGTLLVDPALTFRARTHQLSGSGLPGEGEKRFLFPIPASTSSIGCTIDMQVGYLDPGAVQGVSLSRGLEIVIG